MISENAPTTLERAIPQNEALAAKPASRLFFADHLRVALTILVVIHHLAVTYGAIALWYYVEFPQDPATPLVTSIIVLLNQAFFMGCFFLVAGYFTPGSYDRKGTEAFLRDRLARLGIPLLAYALLINPLLGYIGYNTLPESILQGAPIPFGQFYLLTFSPGPLWFVEALLFFSVMYALWRRITRRYSTPVPANSPPPGYPAILAFTLSLAVLTFLLRIWVPMGYFLPIVGFPSASHLPQYVSLFILGVIAYRNDWFLSIPDKAGRMGFGAAIGSSILFLPLAIGDGTGAFLGGVGWRALIYALWESIFCVGMCLGLVTLFRRRFDRQGVVGKFLSAHAYTVYIIHAPVIVGLAIALRDVHIHPLLKFALVAPVAILLCFLSASFVRKLPVARAIL